MISAEYGSCIGCGVCAAACPHGSIQMALSEELSFRPQINQATCKDCGICDTVCGFTTENLAPRAQQACEQKGYYGFDTMASYFQGYENNHDNYMKSASGGILTALLSHLRKSGSIDAVIHAKATWENGETPLGACFLSRSVSEIEEGRGSFYGPIEFSLALMEASNDPSIQGIAVVCTPCVATNIRLLSRKKSKLAKKIRFIFALMCGHNANGRHGLTILNGYSGLTPPRMLTMRDKRELRSPDSYTLSARSSSGEEQIQQITSSFKPLWRGFWNAEPACPSCIDFAGADADASFKDAWRLSPIHYSSGESAFLVRSPEILNALMEMQSNKDIIIKSIDREAMVTSQWPTIKEKYHNALWRTGSRNQRLGQRIGNTAYRQLKHLSIQLSARMYKRSPRKLQLFTAALTGKFLSAFARFTNERRHTRSA